jgi:hypothetical protein
MAKKGLKEWLDEKWVDIGAPKKNGKYQPCGRQKGSKRAYPKCVPLEEKEQYLIKDLNQQMLKHLQKMVV